MKILRDHEVMKIITNPEKMDQFIHDYEDSLEKHVNEKAELENYLEEEKT